MSARPRSPRTVDGVPIAVLLEGTSFDQDGRPVEVFSTWHQRDHVAFDIDIQREPMLTSAVDAPPSSSIPASSAIAERARRLGAELQQLAGQLEDTGG